MKGSKATLSSFAEKCKTILASNWQGKLSTIKADAEGSKGGIHSSRVKYFIKRGKPYIWVPEKDLHNVNTIIDERSSLAVASPYPGSLMKVLHSLKKLPARVALVGDIVPLGEKKVISAEESLSQTLFSEQETIKDFSHSVSSILSTSNLGSTSRSQNLQDLLDTDDSYMVYKFDIRYYTKNSVYPKYYISFEREDNSALPDDTIMLHPCFLLPEKIDALMLSVDRKGFDVLGKTLGPLMNDGSRQYVWNELRFTFKETASDIEIFANGL